MATVLEIANQALYRVGAEPITALVPSPTSERSRVINASWPFVRTEVLAAHSWNEATTRVILSSYAPEPVWGFDKQYVIPTDCERVLEVNPDEDEQWRREDDKILTDGGLGDTLGTEYPITVVTAADPVAVDATGSGFAGGEVIRITGCDQTELNDRNFLVISPVGDAFALQDEDGTGRSTSSVGTVTLITKGDGEIRYLRDMTADNSYGAQLTMLMVVRLAAEVADRITDSNTTKATLLEEYEKRLMMAKQLDGEEQSEAEFEEDDWIKARI